MKTYSPKPQDLESKWLVIDAQGLVLGRLAAEVAHRLRGKHKPEYAPHMDLGDFIVVVNAEKIKVTGRKMEQKMYYRHSGYPGGIKEINLARQMEKKPEEVIIHAVKGMLPKTSLGRAMLKKMKVYVGPDHPHTAQNPALFEL